MIKKAFLWISIGLLTGVVITSCKHSALDGKDEFTRAELAPRAPASVEHLQANEARTLQAIVQRRDAAKFKQLLVKMRLSQTLATNFDIRARRLQNEDQMDLLLGSQLYCKLWTVKNIHEHTEHQLTYAMTIAKSLGQHHVQWFYAQMTAFAKIDRAFEAAMINLYREFVNNSFEICARENCVAEDQALFKVSIDPQSDSAFSEFMNKNRLAIAQYADVNASDLKPGTCYAQASRVPQSVSKNVGKRRRPQSVGKDAQKSRRPQSVAYDWANRNWIGSVLPAGQFVFTYDDGPHALHTMELHDAWKASGLAKPAFFWQRQNATKYSSIVKELSNEGYVIGSHSERHADLGTLAKATNAAAIGAVNTKVFGPELKTVPASGFVAWRERTLDREITQSVNDLAELVGKPVRYFRLPFGSGVKNESIGRRFQEQNLDHFFWRIDSLDWQDKNPESIRDRVVANMATVKRGIILFHDVHPQSVKASKLLIDVFKNSPNLKAVSILDIPGLQP